MIIQGATIYGNAHGCGAVVRGVFNLQRGQRITLVVGQPSANTTQVSTYSSPAGGGGSFSVMPGYTQVGQNRGQGYCIVTYMGP